MGSATRSRRRLARLLLLAASLILATIGPARAAIDYEPKIGGVVDGQLRDDLEALSQLFALKDKPPDTILGLRQRAQGDIAKLTPAVQGAGYWDCRLEPVIDESRHPMKVTIAVTPGPLYHIGGVTLTDPAGKPPPPLADLSPAALGLAIGGPAQTAPVLAAEEKIARDYANHGRPLAKVTGRKVVIDRSRATMEVTYIVDAGPALRFGPLAIVGLAKTDPAFVRRHVKWREGAVYDARLVDETSKALVATNLFSTVRIDPAKAPDAQGELPLTITLDERVRHSIGAGIDYDTSEGFGANASWQYRNIFGHGESVDLLTELAQQRLGALGRFSVPDFLANDQDLRTETELDYENPDPYTARRLRLFGGLDRHFSPETTGGAGLQVEKASVTENASFDAVPTNIDYTLFSVPFFIRRDASDNQLNPTRGDRENLTVTPYAHIAGPNLDFITLQGKASAYQALDQEDRFIAAEFLGIGSIIGAGVEALPADKRLYLGGGDSVRGYGYQRVGPLAGNALPIGGISSLQTGVELRTKVTETIGLVPFLEGGNVYEHSLPQFDRGLFFGAGLGVRYFTPIGPLRLDVAVPLDKRGSDAAFQVYVSIGQAF